MDFSGKSVLITGGSRGIGKACVQAFAARGAQVAINFRSDKEAAQETLDGLPGGGHMLIQADVAQPSSVQKMIEEILAPSKFNNQIPFLHLERRLLTQSILCY